MCVTTVIQFSVLMFYAAETQNQTTQPDGECSQLSYTLACKILANKVNRYAAMQRGLALYPAFLLLHVFPEVLPVLS